MPDSAFRASSKKRFLLVAAGFVAFLLLFVVAVRITVSELFCGIASPRSSGLSAVARWDKRSMWSSRGISVDKAETSAGESWVARSADLLARSSSFEHSVLSLHQIVAKHHGDFEDLRTESRSGLGRALAAALAVPSEEFDATLSELQTLGRIESISQAGEDSAVRIATAARRLVAAQTTLSRLQRLQRERNGELRDAVALEKDIAQADEAVVEADRLHEKLLSTAALAHIHFTLLEDFRASLRVSAAGTFLEIRNSLVEGISAVLSTVGLVLTALFGYGLPLAFWLALLFWPLRALWRRFHHAPQAAVGS